MIIIHPLEISLALYYFLFCTISPQSVHKSKQRKMSVDVITRTVPLYCTIKSTKLNPERDLYPLAQEIDVIMAPILVDPCTLYSSCIFCKSNFRVRKVSVHRLIIAITLNAIWIPIPER